jgi:sugar fermentation stimulation protein A
MSNIMNDYIKAVFRSRPNRFIAEVEIDGNLEIVHVPNTGRCKELLVQGATVYLLPSNNPKRKTKYSLHFVENEGALVSIYSQQANDIVYKSILDGKIKELSNYDIVEREKRVENSRIDIYLANEYGDCYVEIKGVTLVTNNIAIFPDAPTERGRKHLQKLIKLKKEGHRAVVFFLIQHPNGKSFKPNWETDIDFSKTLSKAYAEGVEILVYKSDNKLDKIEIIEETIEFDLEKPHN